jgi:hypothetical protein
MDYFIIINIINIIYGIIFNIIGTYLGYITILEVYEKLNKYYYYDKKTSGIVKNMKCFTNGCFSDIEYIIDNAKQLKNLYISDDLKKIEKVKIIYNSNNKEHIIIDNHYNIYGIFFMILLIIGILLLWICLLIGIIFNNYLYLIYPLTIIIIIIIILIMYFNYKFFKFL